MDVTTCISNIIEKRKPLAHRIEGVEENLKNLSAALHKIEESRNYLSTEVDDSAIIGRLNSIDFSNIQLAIAFELAALTKLKNSFKRNFSSNN
jgi:hypothetical protein